MQLKAKMILFVMVAGVFLMGASCEEASETGIDDLEISASQCQDSVDNDGDGATDCADTDCQGFVFCVDGGVGSCDCDDAGCSDCCDDGIGTCDDDDGTDCLSCCEVCVCTCDEDGGVDGCLQGSFEIKNELDVEILKPYSCVTGDLGIRAPGLTSFDLPDLLSIGGTLSIVNNPALKHLDGLSRLETVGGIVGVDYNAVLQNIDGLSSLKTVGDSFYISYNATLQNLNGLSGLENVDGTVLVRGNDSLTCDPATLAGQINATGDIGFCGNAPGNGCGPDTCK